MAPEATESLRVCMCVNLRVNNVCVCVFVCFLPTFVFGTPLCRKTLSTPNSPRLKLPPCQRPSNCIGGEGKTGGALKVTTARPARGSHLRTPLRKSRNDRVRTPSTPTTRMSNRPSLSKRDRASKYSESTPPSPCILRSPRPRSTWAS